MEVDVVGPPLAGSPRSLGRLSQNIALFLTERV